MLRPNHKSPCRQLRWSSTPAWSLPGYLKTLCSSRFLRSPPLSLSTSKFCLHNGPHVHSYPRICHLCSLRWRYVACHISKCISFTLNDIQRFRLPTVLPSHLIVCLKAGNAVAWVALLRSPTPPHLRCVGPHASSNPAFTLTPTSSRRQAPRLLAIQHKQILQRSLPSLCRARQCYPSWTLLQTLPMP